MTDMDTQPLTLYPDDGLNLIKLLILFFSSKSSTSRNKPDPVLPLVPQLEHTPEKYKYEIFKPEQN